MGTRNDPEPAQYSAADLGCVDNQCFLPTAIDIIPFQFLALTDDYRVTYEFQDVNGTTTTVSRFLTIRPQESLPITNTGLLEAISESLRIDVADLTTADVSQILSLNASSRNIDSLDGIEVLSYACCISLNGNQIDDISSLANLDSRLTTLDLNNNSIQDIEPLTQVIGLRDIDLANNQIGNLSPLLDNPGLNGLGGDRIDVSGNPIDNNSLNVVIPAIQDLSITTVFDIPLDERLAEVIRSSLNLDSTSSITNINARSIITLNASGQSLTAIDGIEALGASSVDLANNQVANILPLAVTQPYLRGDTNTAILKENLTTLDISNNPISNINALADLSLLRDLTMTGTQVTDLRPLLENEGLDGIGGDRVDVSNNAIDNNSLNVVIPALQDLNIPVIFDLPFASGLAEVIRTSLRLDPTSSITNINARGFITLNAADQNLTAIDGIEALGASTIDLENNQVMNISPLAATQPYLREDSNTQVLKENLTTLNISNNPIADINALADLPLLRVLTMQGTEVTDLSPLLENEGLDGIGGDNVDVSDNALDANSYDSVIPALQTRNFPVTFDLPIVDANLATAVRDARGLTEDEPITNTIGALGINNVDASGLNVKTIEGIQGVGISTLNLADNQIEDLSPLVTRPNYLPGTTVSRTTFITDSDNLRLLNISGNPLNTNSIEVIIPQLEAEGIEVIRD